MNNKEKIMNLDKKQNNKAKKPKTKKSLRNDSITKDYFGTKKKSAKKKSSFDKYVKESKFSHSKASSNEYEDTENNISDKKSSFSYKQELYAKGNGKKNSRSLSSEKSKSSKKLDSFEKSKHNSKFELKERHKQRNRFDFSEKQKNGGKKEFDRKSTNNNIELNDKKGRNRKYQKEINSDSKNVIEGIIQGNERGYAFLLNEEGDYFISHGDLKGAFNGDKVIAKEVKSTGHSRQASVLKIVERGVLKLVGSLELTKNGGFVIPDDRKFSNDIYIPLKKCRNAKDGDKVECKILSYPKKKNPEGEITEVLGQPNDKNTEIKCIAKTYNLSLEFPKKVIQNAKEVAIEPTEEIIKSRRDFRKLQVITIDGDDAKDFDDAISISKEKNNYILGVHIADVSHYVTEQSELDIEAFKRATSVYFPEMVIPMLPEELSNNVCSLMEGRNRLTLSCVMTIDLKGNVISSEIVEGVICSTHRMTYNKVAKILGGDKELLKEYSDIEDMLTSMKELAEILINKRDERGSIDLDIAEAKISVDSNGKIDIEQSERTMANRMIEEFMILANETVAETYFYQEMPFIYRIHERPSEEKLEKFYIFLKDLGFTPKWDKDSVSSKDFSEILDKVEDTPLFPLVNKIMLRSMQKAKYSPEDIGHFGLSSKHYSHFTSPIRRYPDLAIHRIIKSILHGDVQNIYDKYGNFVVEASTQSSVKERNSQEAERAVDDFYKTMYMSDKIGETYKGLISGVTNFGVFVELPNTVEGLIKIETLDGNFTYDENKLTLSNNSVKYSIGEEIEIVVAGADISSRKIEFMLKGSKLEKKVHRHE